MNSSRSSRIVIIILAICLTLAGFLAGRSIGRSEITEQQKQLQLLNRQSIENLPAEGPIYVIGHRSPDADTICSAIAYARLLSLLGYDAHPAISEPANRESIYILSQANVEMPPELVDVSGMNIFLVDHSEYAQAAEGMIDANIVGVLDHHGIGSLTTGQQIVYDARPIGATATIVWLTYLNYGLEIDQPTALLMLGAILSDTDNLTGSATTEADRQAVSQLAELAQVSDVAALYRQIHIEKLSYEGMSGEEILFSDYKEYEAGGLKYGIGLVNAIDEEAAGKLAETMKDALAECFGMKEVDMMYASVGIRENGEKIDYIVCANEFSRDVFVAACPNYDEFDGTSYIFRSGLGRKSKFVPQMNDYLSAHPHE